MAVHCCPGVQQSSTLLCSAGECALDFEIRGEEAQRAVQQAGTDAEEAPRRDDPSLQRPAETPPRLCAPCPETRARGLCALRCHGPDDMQRVECFVLSLGRRSIQVLGRIQEAGSSMKTSPPRKKKICEDPCGTWTTPTASMILAVRVECSHRTAHAPQKRSRPILPVSIRATKLWLLPAPMPLPTTRRPRHIVGPCFPLIYYVLDCFFSADPKKRGLFETGKFVPQSRGQGFIQKERGWGRQGMKG